MMLQKIRYGFGALVLTGLVSGFSYSPIAAQAVVNPQVRSGFDNYTPQRIRSLPNNSLLALHRQLTLFANKRSLPVQVRNGARQKLPLVKAEIRRRGLRVSNGGGANNGGANSGDILTVLHNYQNPRRLSDAQLRQRLTKLERVIDARGVKKKWKRLARTYRASDRAELQRRRDAAANNGNNGGQNVSNLAVLNDRRPLNSLTRQQLRNRISKLEQIIRNPNSRQRHVSKARRMRQDARVELRRRSNANGGNTNNGNTLSLIHI